MSSCDPLTQLLAPIHYSNPNEFFLPRNYSSNNSTLLCVIAGLAALWVISNMKNQQTYASSAMQVPNALVTSARVVSARISSILPIQPAIHAISARITKTTSDPGIVPDAKECKTVNIEGSGIPKIPIADAVESTEDGEAWKSMTDDEKDMVDEGVRKFIKKHDKLVVMIFAPWCPHCHAAMGKFAEFAKSNPKTKCLLVNAEALPRSSFAKEEGAIFPLEYFPTIAKKKGEKLVEEKMSILETKEESPAAEVEEAENTEEPSPTDSSPTETEETEGEMLAKLF